MRKYIRTDKRIPYIHEDDLSKIFDDVRSVKKFLNGMTAYSLEDNKRGFYLHDIENYMGAANPSKLNS
jgi:hypothetical protein